MTEKQIEKVSRVLAYEKALTRLHPKFQEEIQGFVDRNWWQFSNQAIIAIDTYERFSS